MTVGTENNLFERKFSITYLFLNLALQKNLVYKKMFHKTFVVARNGK